MRLYLKKETLYTSAGVLLLTLHALALSAQVAPILPPAEQRTQSFNADDQQSFIRPAKVYFPETWFHFIGGNVSKKGITADLEAIAGSGISGIELFHGQFGGPWPGVDTQITCLSPSWEDALLHTARECRRLGLRFTMQNCPGWAMSGGPWITPQNAMRHLAWSRTDISGGKPVTNSLTQPQPSQEGWRDYHDLMVLAFPTPSGDNDKPLPISDIKGSGDIPWNDIFLKEPSQPVALPASDGQPHWVEMNFPDTVTIRTLELPSVNSFAHAWNYEPGIHIQVEAVMADGRSREILNTDIPAANFQDHSLVSLACQEAGGVKKCRVLIDNKHGMTLGFIHFYSAARENDWESEAGWTLRKIDRSGTTFSQSRQAYIDPTRVIDITSMMDAQGQLKWNAPPGKWTVLRIGHVNSGKKNGPAPPEGTGWECNKLSSTGADAHFAGYIGRLSGQNGVLKNGMLNGMLMDSWECETQTWTANMESEFQRVEGYPLRKWLPALFGFVLKDQETTFRFLHDWRATINDLYTNQFYGHMAKLAKDNHLSIAYETAAGDVFPADILEYYKFADVPMCEFWQPLSEGFVGSANFKPIKPASSAARLYGKPRLAAESFTSFELTWDEHWQALKEVADVNMIDGVTHLVYHTYTHNPRADSLKPGTSFGAGIGTPFLRQQTWWKHMPELNTYFARCSYLQERGNPVSDVLWYLGDEIDHKPDQKAPFPKGFKYDYCNPDVLLNRLSVSGGMLVTPEGIRYRLLWLPETTHMLPETLEKLLALVRAGATVVGEAPKELVTLSGGARAQQRFDAAVNSLWVGKRGGEGASGGQTEQRARTKNGVQNRNGQQSGNNGQSEGAGVRKIGQGMLVSGVPLAAALEQLRIAPDVEGGDALWTHRQVDGADWYFVCPTKGERFKGALEFRNTGRVELWDPITGTVKACSGEEQAGRTSVELDLPQAGSCFVVFHHDGSKPATRVPQMQLAGTVPLNGAWTIGFPEGWGAPASLQIDTLRAWKDLNISAEGKAFSGTVVYNTSFVVEAAESASHYTLDLGDVNMIARVTLNGRPLGTVWCAPYKIDVSGALVPGKNTLQIEVTSTWFNRLAFDAGQPEKNRKTWTIDGPAAESPLRSNGLLGPVQIEIMKAKKPA